MASLSECTTKRSELVWRVGSGVRDIRRGTAIARVRAALLGGGDSMLELGGSDTLNAICERGICRISELASVLRIDPVTATRAVTRLECAGYVQRVADPDDRRGILVAATRTGRETQASARRRLCDFMDRVCAGFNDEELAELVDLLDRLAAGIDGVSA